MHKFSVRLALRIDWSEMDLFGHVNNVSYFKYIQAARVHYWEAAGLPAFGQQSVGPILLSTGCQFIKPLFYPGNIVVESRIEFLKNTSYGLHHRILNEAQEVAAEAHDVIVNYDFAKNEKTPITNELKQAIALIEGHDI